MIVSGIFVIDPVSNPTKFKIDILLQNIITMILKSSW